MLSETTDITTRIKRANKYFSNVVSVTAHTQQYEGGSRTVER